MECFCIKITRSLPFKCLKINKTAIKCEHVFLTEFLNGSHFNVAARLVAGSTTATINETFS